MGNQTTTETPTSKSTESSNDLTWDRPNVTVRKPAKTSKFKSTTNSITTPITPTIEPIERSQDFPISHPNVTIRKQAKTAEEKATTTITTITTKPIRINKDQLLRMRNNATTPTTATLNMLMTNKLTSRTWKKEKKRIRDHLKTRPTKKPKLTQNLPTIINTNVRSVCNKKEELQQVLDDTNTNIVVLTETWITETNEKLTLNEIKKNNPNYEPHSEMRKREDVERGGGVMILIDKSYSTNNTKVKTTRKIKSNLECLVIKMTPTRKPRGYGTLIVAAVYIPPDSSKQMIQAIKELNNIISDATQQNPNPLLIIAGDFNGVNTNQINRTHNTRILNKKSTRKTKLLDLIMSNAPKCYHCINYKPIGNADHDMVKAIVFQQNYKKTKAPVTKIITRKGNIDDSVEEIGNVDWQKLIESKDITTSSKFTIFYDTINEIVDKCQPLKTTKLNNDPKWMTDNIKSAVAHRQKLYAQSIYDNCLSMREKYKEEWKKQRNKVRKLINKRKKKYYRKFTNSECDFWKEVNALKTVPTNNQLDKDTINKLNTIFHQIWDEETQPNLSKFITKNNQHPTIKESTVQHILSNLKTNKAAGTDGLHGKLLKAAKFELTAIVTHLFNESIKHSFIPSQWKEANIVPIPKIPKPTETDWRGISLLSILGKALETIISKTIIQETSDIWLYNEQYGFLPGRSTSDAVIQVLEDWNQAIDQKASVHAVFFDFSKAFDLVDHQLLLTKISKLLSPWLVSWIAAYLTDRKQRVTSNGHTSEWKSVTAGVIQGSVLGPTLFILFLHDIVRYVPAGLKAPKYADDILAYCIHSPSTPNTIQEAVDGICNWTEENKMKLNIKKTQQLIINPPKIAHTPVKRKELSKTKMVKCETCNQDMTESGLHLHKAKAHPKSIPQHSVVINEEEIIQAESYKYLGTVITPELDPDDQWSTVSKKINSSMFLIKQMKKMGFRTPILVTVFKSLIMSHFISQAITLCSASQSAKDEMENVLSKALKIFNISPEEAEVKYNLTSIEHTIDTHCTNTMRKILSNEDHPLTKNLKKPDTRHSFKFIIKAARTTKYGNSFVQKYLPVLEREQRKPNKTAVLPFQLQ